LNPRLTGDSPTLNPIRIESSGTGPSALIPRDINLLFNPTDDRPPAAYYASAPNFTFTKSSNTSGGCTGIILDQGINTEVKNGATFYRPFIYEPDDIYNAGDTELVKDIQGILGIGVPNFTGGEPQTGQPIIFKTPDIQVAESLYINLRPWEQNVTEYFSVLGAADSSSMFNSMPLFLSVFDTDVYQVIQYKRVVGIAMTLSGQIALGDQFRVEIICYDADGNGTSVGGVDFNSTSTPNALYNTVIAPVNTNISLVGSQYISWAVRLNKSSGSGLNPEFYSMCLAVVNY
jgi:hypothetical protein